jgi:putative thioredoxin
LGPTLEKLAAEYKGAFILAKVDVDQNQRLAMQFRVQGIPAVKAFYNGKMAGEFTGALPEPQVRKFIEGLVPSTADLYAKQAYDWEMSDQLPMAVQNYKAALAEKPDHYRAMVGLGRTLLRQGQVEEALAVLSDIPEGVPEKSVADALVATAQFHTTPLDTGRNAGQNCSQPRACPVATPGQPSGSEQRYRSPGGIFGGRASRPPLQRRWRKAM